MASSSSGAGSPAAALLLVSFLAGGAAVVAALGAYLGLDSYQDRKKMKKQNLVPSFLEAMYLYEKELGIGEAVPSTPRQDGFRMPAEWEPHSG